MRSSDNRYTVAVAVAVAAVAASVLVSAIGVVDAFAGPPSTTTTMPTWTSSSSSSSSPSSPFSSAADADTTRVGTLTVPKVGCGTIAWSTDKGEQRGKGERAAVFCRLSSGGWWEGPRLIDRTIDCYLLHMLHVSC